MRLTNESIGQRVRCHGPGDFYDEHFRVVAVYPPGTVLPNGVVVIGATAELDDGCGWRCLMFTSQLSPIPEDCWCDACCVNG